MAYGILVQSALLNQPEVVRQLTALYRVLDLPVSLAELNVDIHDEKQIARLIERTLQKGESIHLLPGNPNAEQLRLALEFVENK